ncbi:MAG TPA: tetratricopeptide repeat protein, partial [Longimicrobiaceae bacterium]|nr:tetratricopeptide repeat protein [Longimicrobiaceae bacterium]
MSRPDATVEEILALLPDLDDFEVLRLRLVGAAVPDPGKAWDSSSAYATFDKRIVTPETADRALHEAQEAVQQYVALLHQGLRPVLASVFSGDHAAAARHLIALGEELEQGGRVLAARQCYRAALTVSLPLAEKEPQILALRRVGRAALNVGDFQEAAAYYERSVAVARDAGDLRGEVIGCTGLGNVRTWQWRWSEAERCYHEALALADSEAAAGLDLSAERGHLYNNLANLTTRQQKLDESEVWFESAFRLWEGRSAVDVAFAHFNRAHLREEQGRWDDARRDYEAALALPIASNLRSLIATDFAEWWLHEGHVTQAEEWGRMAEEHAIASRSPYTLVHMYRGRGKIALARGDADGFTFFEKALEIARD